MRRIAVIGNGGGGKSTLARALGKHLGIPVHEVDEVQWLPGWRRAPLDEVALILEGWTADDAWIIDGFGPWPVIDRRMARADTIIYVDFPFRTHLWWAAKRQVASFVQPRARDAIGSPGPHHEGRPRGEARASALSARDVALARRGHARDRGSHGVI